LDWPIPDNVLRDMGLVLTGSKAASPFPDALEDSLIIIGPELQQTAPPPRTSTDGHGVPTTVFQSKKTPDHAKRDAGNRKLGCAGELLVVAHEKRELEMAGRQDLADLVEHTAAVEGDGAGFDVRSFLSDGSPKFIEVKTTRGDENTEFYITRNKLEFSKRNNDRFYLYRVYEFEVSSGRAKFYVVPGALSADTFSLIPVQFRARR
jgi:hypothetical protein